MYQNHQIVSRPPPAFRGSLKALEADIQHANTLADAIRRACGGPCLQMKLSYSTLAPLFFYLMRWLDCTCTYTIPSYFGLLQVLVFKVYVDGTRTVASYERRASLKEFYAVIYPSLQLLESSLVEKENTKAQSQEVYGRKRVDDWRRLSDADREDECGICMELCTKMVLPNCNHAMCINCFRDWSTRSESCPFCRGA